MRSLSGANMFSKHIVHSHRQSLFDASHDKLRRRFPNIVIEGDSWFDYPGRGLNFLKGPNNIFEGLMLAMPHGCNWLDSAIFGARAAQVAKEPSVFRYAQARRIKIDLFCLSAGGNDIFASLELFLRDYQSSFSEGSIEQCFNEQKDQILLRLKAIYTLLLEDRDRYMPHVPFLTHDYAAPTQRVRAYRLLGLKAGPWINSALDKKGYPRVSGSGVPDIRLRIIDYLHKALSETLKESVLPFSSSYVYSAKDRALDLAEQRYWDDEIHLSPQGVKKFSADMLNFMREQGIYPTFRF